MSVAGAGYLAAFAGGLVSFASPCVLPLVPAYLSVITGLEISEIEQCRWRHLWRVARDTGLFIAGFAVVFIILGLTATALGRAGAPARADHPHLEAPGAGVRVVHRRVAVWCHPVKELR